MIRHLSFLRTRRSPSAPADETLALLKAAQSQAPDATTKERLAFQNAGKKLEGASKRALEKAAMARGQAKMAADAAAKKGA